MDQKYVGRFIQTLRKEKGLTQRELADRICVSDKTISKWENGNSMPDTSMLMDLCNELDVSVNELLSCERIPPEEYSKKAEVTIMNLMKENQDNKKSGRIQYIFGIVFLTLTLLVIVFSIGVNVTWFIDLPNLLLLAGGCAAVVFLSGSTRNRYEVACILRKSVIPMGTLMTAVTMIAIFFKLDSPDKLFPNLAVAALELIYSLIAYFIFLVLEQRWKKTSAD